VKRGEVYIAAARGPYTGKPRPVLVIQDDSFDATASITVCPFTTNRSTLRCCESRSSLQPPTGSIEQAA